MQRCIAAGSVVWGWPALAWQEGPSEHGMLPVLCGECELVHERERALSPPSPSCAVQSPCPHPTCFCPSRKQVLGTKVDAERDGVKVPTTLAEYCVKTKTPAPDEGSDLFYDDYYEDDEMEEEADSCYGDEDDSGNEES